MSRKRTLSDLSDVSGEVEFYPDRYVFSKRPRKMPRQFNRSTAARRPLNRPRLFKRRRYTRRTTVPRTIATRGTPSGYYELPVRVFWKLYVNTSTGAFNTDPQSGAQSGATGYQGLSLSLDYLNVYVGIGNGSVSTQIQVPISGATELQAVFDQCKYYRVDFEFWWTNGVNQSPTAANAAGAPELFIATDPSGALPPANQGQILQYSDLMRCMSNPDKVYRKSIFPQQRTILSTTEDPTSNTSTASGSQYSTYFETEKPNVRHNGLIGFINLPTNQTTTQLYYINCMTTIYRRFKVSK